MHKLVMIRHGESLWNKENRFTGWTDVDLADTGIREAIEAGELLKKEGYVFDLVFTSLLKRAVKTLWHVLDRMDLQWIPVVNSFRLNERHYGALQGLDKAEMAARYGEEQVHLWRRGYDVLPPLLETEDPRHPKQDPRYRGIEERLLPAGESLKDTVDRVIPLWRESIAPAVLSGRQVLISAHGNSLRALVMHLDGISREEIVSLNIPTGIPLVYELDDGGLPLRHYYLGDPERVRRGIEKISLQGKKKAG